jgi:hypothetical protein
MDRYRFEVIDTNGRCELVAEILASDMTDVFDKVTEISDGISHPGCRIRVKDQDGNAVFVGVTIGQGVDPRRDIAA